MNNEITYRKNAGQDLLSGVYVCDVCQTLASAA